MPKAADPHTQVSAVILNWRDPSNTLACVESLKDLTEISQIFIVHNENTHSPFPPQTFSSFATPVIEIFNPENRGFSAGINSGIQQSISANCDAVLLINNDAVLAPHSLVELMSGLDGPQTGMVAPIILNPDNTLQAAGASVNKRSLSVNEKSSKDFDFLTFACVLIKSSTFEKVGLLDEAFFMYWEDVDFGLRVKAAGLELVVVPEATAIHAVSSSRKIAGSRIDLYSAFGLGAFGVLHAQYKFGSFFRITLRVLKRVVMLQFSFAYKILKAFRDGQKLDRPSYLKVTKENWPLKAL